MDELPAKQAREMLRRCVDAGLSLEVSADGVPVLNEPTRRALAATATDGSAPAVLSGGPLQLSASRPTLISSTSSPGGVLVWNGVQWVDCGPGRARVASSRSRPTRPFEKARARTEQKR